jgi:colicin import membrane protein
VAAENKAREDALQGQLEAERDAREITRYAAAIRRQIEASWLKPPNVADSLKCTLRVRLLPGGDVVPGSVSVIESSGNAAFDRSVESAVYKAAPLPVPGDRLFESFRELELVFDPSR